MLNKLGKKSLSDEEALVTGHSYDPGTINSEEFQQVYASGIVFYPLSNGHTVSGEAEDLASTRHSSGCDDSGVFLEDLPYTPENITTTIVVPVEPQAQVHHIDDFTNRKHLSPEMRQYSIDAQGLDSDAEKSDDLGLASSSVDSADDLDGDPLPSTLKIEPLCPSKKKPPPIPPRKSVGNGGQFISQKELILTTNTSVPPAEVITTTSPTPLVSTVSTIENEAMPSENFIHSTRKHSEGFKWKSEECLRSAVDSKWSQKHGSKSISVKDRIAMFSEMETTSVAPSNKKEAHLHRYPSETNVKSLSSAETCERKDEITPKDITKTTEDFPSLNRDTKWYSMYSLPLTSTTSVPDNKTDNTDLKTACSASSLTTNNKVQENANSSINDSSNGTAILRVDTDTYQRYSEKPIVSSYPQTQLANNKRYNYGRYSLNPIRTTDDLLAKKNSGLLSIIDSRKQPLAKLKGLVIPDRPLQSPTSKTLPTIVSNDSLVLNSKTDVDIEKDCKRSMLSAASYKTMSLPRTRNEMKAKLEPVSYDISKLMSEPPWKSNATSNKSNALPKYSPAFKARTALDFPNTVTSSLSPTPPSSITSPLSPPPSSPSSICSSNASSATSVATMQQNIFQFSLSHSKPVTPILPEKPIMSPPSLPSDIEYEGDNSEDSSTSASPMAGKISSSKLGNKILSTSLSALRYEKPVEFSGHGQVRSEPLSHNDSDGNDYYDSLRPSSHDTRPMNHAFIQEKIGNTDRQARQQFLSTVNKSANLDYKMNDKFQDSYQDLENGRSDYRETANLNNINVSSSAPPSADTHDIYSGRKNIFSATSQEVQAVKFRAQPLTLNQIVKNGTCENSSKPLITKTSSNEDTPKITGHRNGYDVDDTKSMKDETKQYVTEYGYDKHPWSKSTDLIRYKNKLDSEEDEDDSHSSLSHRTEDSRPTTDDYFSDATTDSFDKSFDPDLKPRRLSQQKVVLKAAVQGTDSVQKFKALAEKWEQRTDAKSPPPPPPPVLPAPRKEYKLYAGSVPAASSFLSSVINSTSNFPSNGTSNTPLINTSLKLPPSLMPRSKSHTDIKNITQNHKTQNHSQNPTPGNDPKHSSNLYGKDSKNSYESVWIEDSSRKSSINGYRDHSDSGSSTDTGSNYCRKKSTDCESEKTETSKTKERVFSNGSVVDRKDFVTSKVDSNSNSSQTQKMENEVFASEDDIIFYERKMSNNDNTFSTKNSTDVSKDKNITNALLNDMSDTSSGYKLRATEAQVQANESSPDYLRKRLHSDGKSLPDPSWKSESTLDLTTRRNTGREFQPSDFLTARTLSKSQVSLRDPLESVRSHGSSLFSSKNAKSISVSDIRKAFETQTMQNQVLSSKPPPLPPRNADVSPKVVYRKTSSHRISSTDHKRLSSFDSTASGDSDPVSPVRCGSVGSLTSISKDSYGSVTSLASTTSLISPQELQQLIDEANQSLDEDTKDSTNQDIQVIVLHREVPSGSIGITLAGGADYEIKEITVHKVISGSLADRDGRLRKGDRVISINGRMLKGTTHKEALDILKAPRPEVVLVIAREKTEMNTQSNGLHHNHLNGEANKMQMDKPSVGAKEHFRKMRDASSLSSKGSLDETSTMNIVCVHLQKDAAGLGFSIEGGKGSPQGDRPLLIKRIFKGGVADKDGKLQVGDEIVSVNGQSVTSMTRTEAWNFLKKLPEEPILLRARKQFTCS